MLRIAHATDIHWMVPPPLRRLPGKRLLGSLNLYLKGRKTAFSREVQSALVQTIADEKPDVFVLSGDITAMALQSEFQVAKDALAPILEHIPSFVVPGNHDLYTIGAKRDHRIEQYFGDHMALNKNGVGVRDIHGIRFIGLNPNKPGFFASGVVPQEQLLSLAETLEEPQSSALPIILVIHYPLMSPNGNIYDGIHHGLTNAAELISVLKKATAKPFMILHGHKHHGYRAQVDLESIQVPTINPGSSGMTRDERTNHTGAFNIYTIEKGTLSSISRYIWNGEAFLPEEGGPYCSGW
jgi:3',5'-cyclic AMP phosphodiesterase CpdA